MSDIDTKTIGLGFFLGILVLIGGILLAYFGLLAPPYFLIVGSVQGSVYLASLLLPFVVILIGAELIYVSFKSALSPGKEKIEEKPQPQVLQLPPAPPPSLSPSSKRYCRHCGAELRKEDKFCRRCGKEVPS